MAHLETPYDQGSPWKLREGTETAVVSEGTAAHMQSLGVPVNEYGAPEEASSEVLAAVLTAVQGGTLQLSQKAQRLLRRG
jgi:hypothetical protein